MKLTPELERTQQRMQPGVVSLHGFLGSDRRNLADILAADQDIVNGLDLTHGQIADRLQALTDRARDALGSTVLVDNRYEVRYEEVLGSITSPFGSPHKFPKDAVRLKDRRSGETLRWTSLGVHMIREHGFYEGVGSPYRLDPEHVARVLDIQP